MLTETHVVDPWILDFARQVSPPDAHDPSTSKPLIATPADLETYIWETFGVRLPKTRICAQHQSPWEAFCAAYFATEQASVVVIKGSRGLAGKSWLIALLGNVIALTLRGDVTILGGSAAQSNRVHAHQRKFWAAPNAPQQQIVASSITKTEFRDGQTVEALTASPNSVRGPHPLCLIIDECDEMAWDLFDASMGQTMDAHGHTGRTVIASTHQHPDGTMTRVLKMATEKQWKIFEWCWKETLEPHGWLTETQVRRKRNEMTATTWNVEVELQEPSPEGRAIDPAKVERMFLGPAILADVGGGEFPYREFEPPIEDARYVTGADWARSRDYVEIVTLRDDIYPLRLVAYQRFQRRATPYIIASFERQTSRYPGNALHDSTSMGGKMMADFVEDEAGLVEGFDFGRHRLRQEMFTDYIIAIESEEIVSPRIDVLYRQHKFVRNEDLRPRGTGHPPDGFVAGAMAYRASGRVSRPLRIVNATAPPVSGNGANGGGDLRPGTWAARAFGSQGGNGARD